MSEGSSIPGNKGAHNSDTSSSQRQVRIGIIKRLLLRGVKSVPDIQQNLKSIDRNMVVDDRTIFRDLATIKEEHLQAVREKQGLQKPLEELIIELKENFDEISRELWNQYHAPQVYTTRCPHPDHKGANDCGFEAQIKIQSTATKVMALKEIRTTAEKVLELMQSTGFIDKAPEKIQFLDKDGKPTDPTGDSKQVLNQQFISFFKATFQNPHGVKQPES